MTVVSFTDYTPPPRFDNTPWTTTLIEEAEAETGPWSLIDTQPLLPVDADPANPMTRSFSTDQATLVNGWYKVSFADTNNNIVENPPWYNGETVEWTPTLSDVGHTIITRTRDGNGVILSTFTDATVPTDDQARVIIQQAVDDVAPLIGTDIPAELISEAQHVAALRAAMYVELNFYGNEVAQNRSVYPHLKALFDEKVKTLQGAIIAIEAGGSMEDQAGGAGGAPAYAYPEPIPILDGRL